ncbi:MAG: hypothetical protein ACXVBK_15960 [Flavisolibacter sp.]
MKYYLTLILICFSTISAAETGSDFWKDCPGPACPENAPPPPDSIEYKMQHETVKSLEKMNTPELNKRELKLKQEIKTIMEEKQRRDAM